VLGWVFVAVVVGGTVTAVVFRRRAAKVLAVALTGMLVLAVFAARQSVDDIRDRQQAALCVRQRIVAGNLSAAGRPRLPDRLDR